MVDGPNACSSDVSRSFPDLKGTCVVKLGLVVLALVPLTSLGLLACSGASNSDLFARTDAGQEVSDAALPKELVCASSFCGTIADKVTGATADCGSCPSGSQCGDNGIGNVCGSSCMPYMNQGALDTRACDYAFGSGWGQGYGTEMEFPPSCFYMDPSVCVPIYNPWPSNGACSGAVCGAFYCCVSDADAGYNPLLPGAVAGNDGGLP